MIRRALLILLMVATLGGRALAEEPPAPRPEASPVRAGKTTVTVIDENESVDDVVTRVRAARGREGPTREQPGLPRTPPAGAQEAAADRPGPEGAAVRRALRDARAAGAPRPGPVVRERIRERIQERKPVRPRAEQVLRRQRNR